MWLAKARYLSNNPQYTNFAGPLSIPGEYNDLSKALVMGYLLREFKHPQAEKVTPRVPPTLNTGFTDLQLQQLLSHIHSIDDLQNAVRISEKQPLLKLPPFIKIYLEVRVRFFAFNWDEDFNTLDAFIGNNLVECDFEVQAKYMGAERARAYRLYHGLCAE
jgi:hypothetical protein